MNDFLQSLRNSKAENQRIPMTRKTYHNVYHQTKQRFPAGNGYQPNGNPQMKRPPVSYQSRNQMPAEEGAPSILTQAVETLNSQLEILLDNQTNLISAQERTADMLERQASAIERIVDHLTASGKQSVSFNIDDSQFRAASKADTITAGPVENLTPGRPITLKRKKIIKKDACISNIKPTKRLGRDEIMGIIHQMRKEGAIFDQIAKRLIAMGQPTFSGRGEWHAQTIHRLCNR